MKARELRIGSQVDYHGTICKVTAVSDSSPTIETPEGNSAIVPIDLLEGVNLTEEWLLRAGFVESGGYWFPKPHPEYFTYLMVDAYGCEGMVGYCLDDERVIFKPIEFVHQLQNLYHALAGKELEL